MCRAARRPLATDAAPHDERPLGFYGVQAAPPAIDDPVLDGARYIAVVYVTERYGKSTAIPLHRLPGPAVLHIARDFHEKGVPRWDFFQGHPTYIVGPAAAARIKVEMAPNLLQRIDWRHV